MMFRSQSMFLEEQASTSDYDLSKIVQHSWHIASENKGIDLFEVIVDDLAWPMTLMSRYIDFLDFNKS